MATAPGALLAGAPARLSPLFLVGLATLGVGGAADLVHHLLPASVAHEWLPLFGPEAVHAHLATFAGMALMLVSIIRRGLRS